MLKFKYIRQSKSLLNSIARSFSKATYDLVVIGGGPGGYVSAIKAGQLGLKTACIEGRGALGGTCLNVGCIPSKALLNITHHLHTAKTDFAGFGLNTGPITVDWNKTQQKREEIVKGLTGGIAGLFKKNKVDWIKGWGTLKSNKEVSVKMENGKTQLVNAKNIIIATGSKPVAFPGVEFDEQVIVSNTGSLASKTIPKKMITIGGGIVGLEMGSVYSRLGTEVNVIEYANAIAGGCDSEISKVFETNLKQQGLKFHKETMVTKIKRVGNEGQVTVENVGGGNKRTFNADMVLVATGRRPFTDGLGAKELGINFNKFGQILINSTWQTNIPNIYAIGDCVPGWMLAHKAEEEGIAAVEHIVKGKGHVNYDLIPAVIYTWPEVAWTGKTEEQLKEEGVQYKVGRFPFLANSRARTNDDAQGLVKVICEKRSGELLGVHMIGPNVSEMIHESCVAMEFGATAKDVSYISHAHPTLSEAVREAHMDAAFGTPIHF